MEIADIHSSVTFLKDIYWEKVPEKLGFSVCIKMETEGGWEILP